MFMAATCHQAVKHWRKVLGHSHDVAAFSESGSLSVQQEPQAKNAGLARKGSKTVPTGKSREERVCRKGGTLGDGYDIELQLKILHVIISTCSSGSSQTANGRRWPESSRRLCARNTPRPDGLV